MEQKISKAEQIMRQYLAQEIKYCSIDDPDLVKDRVETDTIEMLKENLSLIDDLPDYLHRLIVTIESWFYKKGNGGGRKRVQKEGELRDRIIQIIKESPIGLPLAIFRGKTLEFCQQSGMSPITMKLKITKFTVNHPGRKRFEPTPDDDLIYVTKGLVYAYDPKALLEMPEYSTKAEKPQKQA